ncbi:hypothetical protein [Vallicoccus soli]|uniref:Type IV secretion system protein n=1 Tax=Vallicoccus soli TaxID=2339232 RepID=A0A3A3Z099_9ACTN|nr:hypothetical protein [Vallicoccus soli]RJK95921.1 hypothetical protein D5H78_09985 [Vallicoccus soli]
MPCIPTIPATCAVADDLIGAAAGAAAGAAGDAAADTLGNSFADAMREGAAWVIRTTIGWWIDVPAVDLTETPVDDIRGYLWWLALAVAAAGVAWQGLRMAISRKPDPLVDIGRGLVTLALWAGIGVAGPAAALRAGDAFSSWVLEEASRGQVADRLVRLAGLGGVDSAGAVILFGLVMMVAGIVQAVIMVFREGAVVILAGVVVLAAAGNFTAYGRPWLMKVLTWMVALIAYKPVAALVYATALTLAGEGEDPRTVVVGLTMMALSIVALPALMKFFTWAGGTASGIGGAAALVGITAAGIQTAAAIKGGMVGGAAGAQAAQLRQDLGPAAGPAGSTGAGPSGAGGYSGPAMVVAAPPAASATTAASSGPESASARTAAASRGAARSTEKGHQQ